MRTRLVALALLLAAASSLPRAARAQDGLARAQALAKQSTDARDAMETLRFQAGKIQDPALKAAAKDLLENPAPTFMQAWPDAAAREKVRGALVEAKLLAPDVSVDLLFPPLANALKAPAPFDVAPAGDPQHHHGYPGGLAVHTAFNVQAALDLARNYRNRYGVVLDPDLVIAAPLLHDCMKPWAFQWKRDGTITAQPKIADTGSHHIFAIAEAIHRGLSPTFVVALASAHDTPTGDTAPRVVGYLRAAAILAGVDPVEKGILVRDGEAWRLAALPPLEATVNHLSDHDYVLLDPAAALEADALDRLARDAAKKEGLVVDDARLRWMRHRIHQKISGVQIYAWLVDGGDERVAAELKKHAVPLLDKKD
ncbi:MAG TPA: metal-dependent phosphohydrolase [bacterium]|nr:metal-dependent phosphohydrolase [bacterium]